MSVFFALMLGLLPLYALIALGYGAARWYEVERESLASLAIYIIAPIVMFGYMAQIKLEPSYMLLPLLYYIFLTIVTFTLFSVGRKIYGDKRANLAALLTASHNSGYFGLPVIIMLFDQQWVGVYMLMALGGIFYESTIAYYLAARGSFSVKESLHKLVRYPSLYALPLGLLANFAFQRDMPDLFVTYWTYFKGAYVVVGMMIIGAALAKLRHFEFSLRFNALVYAGKLLLWPALMGGFVMLDNAFFGLFEENVHAMMLVLAILPPAANVTAFAMRFNIDPEKAATTVLVGTLLALFYIPAILIISGMQ